jgi:hypothetical protein
MTAPLVSYTGLSAAHLQFGRLHRGAMRLSLERPAMPELTMLVRRSGRAATSVTLS